MFAGDFDGILCFCPLHFISECIEKVEVMESIEREKILKNWLATAAQLPSFTLQAMPGDASFRRYFRAKTAKQSFVVMDALKENCRPYVAVANALREMGLQTPEIFYADFSQGFLLLTDFGDTTYLKELNTSNVDRLYRLALTDLAILQHGRHVPDHTVPFFSSAFMWQEWVWHKEWFLHQWLGLSMMEEMALDACVTAILASACEQPQVFMHRDFHSANLMVLNEEAVGILDFQDAFIGPITYDLVSLLRDCYIDWQEEDIKKWVCFYWQLLREKNELILPDQTLFLRWFDWMGIQRHLKALFTFARKQVRDHQSRYLKYIPRTLRYIVNVSARYPELRALHDYYNEIMLSPAINKKQRKITEI